MTPTDFIAKFSSSTVLIDAPTAVEGDVVLDSTNFRCKVASIANVTFDGTLVLKDIKDVESISFKKCIFNRGVEFNNITATGYDADVKGFYSLELEECQIKASLLITISAFERGIRIRNCKQDEHQDNTLLISKCAVSKGEIKIDNTTASILQLLNLEIYGIGLGIYKSEIKEYIRIQSLETDGGLSVIKNEIEGDVHIWGGKTSAVTFNHNEFKQDVRIEAVDNTGPFTSFRDDFAKYLQIDFDDSADKVKARHDSLYFNAVKFGIGLMVNGFDKVITELNIHCSLDLTGTLQFNSCRIDKAIMYQDNHKANIVFNYCRFGVVNFEMFNNYGNVIFSSCKANKPEDSETEVPTEFIVSNSNLGKTQFQNFFFSSFDKVSIIDSLVSGIEFSGMHWFDEKVLDVGDSTSPWRRQREVYRQLKQASEKQNDKFQALIFQSLELKAYKQEIGSKGRLATNDGIILWLGQTNDFGLNWLKPMGLLVLTSTILYFPIVISASCKISWLPACNYSDLKATLSEFWNYTYMWPQLYNPARTLKHAFHDGAQLGVGVYFWDMVQRIVLAFFIVQIVSAFRKYFKS
jgi:hypothetical protein